MNTLDKQYTDLLQDILDNGIKKQDRTGTGTISVFGRQIRHNMKDGFPLLTTKKMPFKTIVTELLWFLRGDTNIKYLVDNDCNIWNGDAYKNYINKEHLSMSFNFLSQEEFINKIKTDDEFAKKWGELGKIYGLQWRNWGGWKDTKQTGFLHKTDNGWTVKWSDLHSFANGTEWLTTPIQDSDQSLYSDEDEGKKVYYKNITLGYNESFCPVQVSKVIDDKFDKYVGGIDQIQNLISDLKTNPDSRRLQVNAWAVHDLPNMVLPPCHYGFQVYTRELSYEERCDIFQSTESFKVENREYIKDLNIKIMNDAEIPTRTISLMWNQRSVDTGLGLPFNIASYGLLLTMLAEEVNMVPDQLIGNLGDVHLYSNHVEPIKEQFGRKLKFPERTEMLKDKMGEKKYNKAVDELIPFGGGMSEYFETYEIPYTTREPLPLPKVTINPNNKMRIGGGIFTYDVGDFTLEDYVSHPTIKLPLSN